jgi:hypothetical protein
MLIAFNCRFGLTPRKTGRNTLCLVYLDQAVTS